MTLPQWLEAANIRLEDENENAEENLLHNTGSKYPKRRLTGVNIVLDVSCSETPYHHLKVPDTEEWKEVPVHHDIPVVCQVTPRAASSVAEKVEVVYDTVRDKDEVISAAGRNGGYVYRERYTFGVHFTMGTAYGQFREFSWSAAIIGFSATITAVLLARTVTRVVATFFLGDM